MMFNRNLFNNYNPEQTNLSPKNNHNADQSYAFIHHSLYNLFTRTLHDTQYLGQEKLEP